MADEPKKPRFWPGMPTKGSQFVESIAVLSLPMLAVTVSTVLYIILAIRGCVAGH